MIRSKAMKTKSLEEFTDKYIGKIGTPERDEFENELRLDLIGEAIRLNLFFFGKHIVDQN